MRTKTLLIAAAALAATIISSEAQTPVYSANVVGYVTLATAATNQFALFANPLDNGTNNITSLFPSAPNQTVVEIWNGIGFQTATKVAGNWNTNLNIPVGTGFFIKYPVSAGLVTNTFAGQVASQIQNGSSSTNTIGLPANFVLLGSPFPIGGDLTNSGDSTLNLGTVLVNQSVVEIWNGVGFQTATKVAGNWNTNLNLSVGQGFFVKAKTGTNWVESLTLQ
jgi:hypothetical protein